MTQMSKREYVKPSALEIEMRNECMICTSIPISDEETNDAGRVSKQGRNGWNNGLWGN